MRVSIPQKIRVLQPDDSVREMDLEDYVRGVVSAAMPADTPLEALKAQAVAARTFGVITQRHTEKKAEVCTTRHCQLWLESISANVARAIDETRGVVITFENKLIHAFYFEHCDGHTRDAHGVLIEPAPYCKAVACPCGFAAPRGHGIGMCQRGASVMARTGAAYEKILLHYYTGVELTEGILVARRPAPRPVVAEIQKRAPAPRKTTEEKTQPAALNVSSASLPEEKPQPLPPPPLRRIEIAKPQTPPPAPNIPAPTANVVTPAREVTIPPDVLKRFSRGRHEQKPVTPTGDISAPPPDLPEEISFSTPPSGAFPEGLPEPLGSSLPPALDSLPEPLVPDSNPNLVLDYLPGARMLAGDLRTRGIVVTVYDEQANTFVGVSGGAPRYGEGGFEIALPHGGEYRVEMRGATTTVRLGDETAFVTLAESD